MADSDETPKAWNSRVLAWIGTPVLMIALVIYGSEILDHLDDNEACHIGMLVSVRDWQTAVIWMMLGGLTVVMLASQMESLQTTMPLTKYVVSAIGQIAIVASVAFVIAGQYSGRCTAGGLNAPAAGNVVYDQYPDISMYAGLVFALGLIASVYAFDINESNQPFFMDKTLSVYPALEYLVRFLFTVALAAFYMPGKKHILDHFVDTAQLGSAECAAAFAKLNQDSMAFKIAKSIEIVDTANNAIDIHDAMKYLSFAIFATVMAELVIRVLEIRADLMENGLGTFFRLTVRFLALFSNVSLSVFAVALVDTAAVPSCPSLRTNQTEVQFLYIAAVLFLVQVPLVATVKAIMAKQVYVRLATNTKSYYHT
jgi:hypothetical protein